MYWEDKVGIEGTWKDVGSVREGRARLPGGKVIPSRREAPTKVEQEEKRERRLPLAQRLRSPSPPAPRYPYSDVAEASQEAARRFADTVRGPPHPHTVKHPTVAAATPQPRYRENSKENYHPGPLYDPYGLADMDIDS